jgi:hypothetical protein
MANLATRKQHPLASMSEGLAALLAGLAIFLIPAGAFAWSVFTKKGRATYERGISEQKDLPMWGGLIPLRSPKGHFSRWATDHPNAGALAFGLAVGLVSFLVSIMLFDSSVERSTGRGVFSMVEYGIFARLFFGAMHKHHGSRPERPNEGPSPEETAGR